MNWYALLFLLPIFLARSPQVSRSEFWLITGMSVVITVATLVHSK